LVSAEIQNGMSSKILNIGRLSIFGVIVMYNNVDLISGTYDKKGIASGKTANSSISTIPPRFDDGCPREAFEYLKVIYIAKN